VEHVEQEDTMAEEREKFPHKKANDEAEIEAHKFHRKANEEPSAENEADDDSADVEAHIHHRK
jgi:hypothetical protein